MCSDDACFLEQEEEGAALAGRGVGELGLGEAATVPELKPVEVVRALLNVVFHPAMLEEELLVAPVRADRVGPAHEPADEFFSATELGRLVVGEDLEHDCVHGDDRHLVLKVVLVLVAPAIDIVRLDVQLVGPVRVGFLHAVLVILGDLHD